MYDVVHVRNSAKTVRFPDTVSDANPTTMILAELSLWFDSIARPDRRVLLKQNVTIITCLSYSGSLFSSRDVTCSLVE